MLAQMLWALAAANDLTSGIKLYMDRQFRPAERVFRAALARNKNDSRAHLYLIRSLIGLGRNAEGLVELDRLLGTAKDPEVRFQAGKILRSLAEQRFTELERVAPNSAAVKELLGARFERTGDLEQALKHYREAAALDPKRPGVHYRAGNIQWRMRDLDGASAELRAELASNPHHGLANLRLGQILLAGDEHLQAIPHLERAVTAMSGSTEARKELGKAYKKADRTEDARRQWEIVARAKPDDDQVHYLLGNLLRESGESALAAKELELHRIILKRRRALSERKQQN
jgi:tetratricopeptide (TPR) repeat protein